MPDIDRFGRSERDYSRPSTPIQSGGSRGEFSDRLYTGRNPFIQPWGDDFSNVNTPRAGVPTMPMGMPSAAGQTRFGTPSNIGYDRAGPARRFGPPADIGFGRAGPSRFGPPADIGYDRAGAGIFGENPDDYMQTAYNVGDTYPLGQIDNYGRRLPNSPDPVYNDLKTVPLDMQFDQWGNPIGSDDYGYFNDIFAARGGLMSLRR